MYWFAEIEDLVYIHFGGCVGQGEGGDGGACANFSKQMKIYSPQLLVCEFSFLTIMILALPGASSSE